MARGGARPGAGRKKGQINSVSAKARAAAAATGALPHELLLATARGQSTPGLQKPTREEIFEARKAVAQFYAPKLAAVVARVNPPGNLWHEIFSLIDGTSRGLPEKPAGGSSKTPR